MKVFLTGATGYIGSAVAEVLARAAHHAAGPGRSPGEAGRLAARGARPSRRWTAAGRPDTGPREASRGVRSPVARGSIAYSLVSHPSPVSRRNGGTRPSTVTLHTTTVSPAGPTTP